ncbi:hypothetical protein RRF57_009646 [Xylaria bambusicola]|uniref:Uncharacterized protein n=1 Tax=Xylaria bambusicola TaxID=326684 RepID=A0AAN7Z800_9PEZI
MKPGIFWNQYTMLNLRSLFLATLCLYTVEASPQNRNGRNGNGRGSRQRLTAQEQADQIPQGISTATDGSTILDTTARVKVDTDGRRSRHPRPKCPAARRRRPVLLRFPNQAVQNNFTGVAILAPDPNLFWGGGSGLERTDGVAHAQIVNDLIKDILPQVLAFDSDSVSFTGVSGGSLLLSGFFMPGFMQNFASPAAGTAGLAGSRARSRFALRSAKRASTGQKTSQVLLNCGALAPQVSMSEDAVAALANTRIHFQSTQAELAELQTSIPEAIVAYEQAVSDAGLATQQIAALQTVDNSPDGGHCEFDEKDFVSGVQLMADSFAAVVQGGDGVLAGTNLNVLNPVPGNERLSFSGAS